ncbi:MAG: hypothetical protein AAGK47_07565 [Bacteroidota bacterium]
MRIFSILSLFSVLLLFSCSNEFELNAPPADVTVVYGFLNQDDPVHYIRVERGFISDELNGFQLAQNPDSLYYDNAVVQLVRLDKNNETITLERVDGNEVGVQREEGIFANSPNILYGFSLEDENKLEGGELVELRVILGEEKEVVTAQTTVIGAIDFQQGRPAETGVVFAYGQKTNFAWFAREGGQLFDLVLDINIQELSDDNMEFTDRKLEWVVERNVRRAEEDADVVRVNLDGELFYQFLKSELENEPRRKRFFRSIDVRVSAAGQELLDFTNVALANTGITSAQDVPSYTNITGGNGIGLLTSRKTVSTIISALDSATRDSLRTGIYTKDLNFQ